LVEISRSIQVTVQVFAYLRDCLPAGVERGRIVVDVPEHADLRALFDYLGFDRCLPGDRRLVDELDSWQVSLNGEFVLDLKHELRSGDQVLVFPHIAGGSGADHKPCLQIMTAVYWSCHNGI